VKAQRTPPFSREKQKANRLYLTHLDMQRAEDYLHALDNIENQPGFHDSVDLDRAVDALFFAAIVVYARPFVRNESTGYADAVAGTKAIFKGFPELRLRHTKVIDLRHTGAAHAQWDLHGTMLMFDARTNNASRMGWSPDFRDELSALDFWELIVHVNDRAVAEFIRLDKVIATHPDGPDMNFWRRRLPAG
jgi:hypothetical protein